MHHTNHSWSEGRGRFLFLDLYRGIIVLFMIEGHVLREVLLPSLRQTEWFRIHEIIHGITAPGFLFGAGFAFAIATQRKWEQAVTLNIHFLRRLWRALLLILIGYALHVPYLSLQKSLALATEAEWKSFFAFDVLQCIGFGLLLLRLLLFVIKKERLFLLTVLLLLIGIVYTTPLLGTSEKITSLPLLLSSAIRVSNVSYFPLFPFLGFLLAGTLVSWMFLRAAQQQKEDIFIKSLFWSGVGLISITWLLEIVPVEMYSTHDFWHTSPNYFWMRLGFLFLLMSALWYIEDSLLSHSSFSWARPKWLTTLGMQSLFVYIAHLIVLYGWVYNTELNMRVFWKDSLDLVPSLGLTLALTALMTAGAFGWRYLQKHHPLYLRGVLFYLAIITAFPFFFSPN